MRAAPVPNLCGGDNSKFSCSVDLCGVAGSRTVAMRQQRYWARPRGLALLLLAGFCGVAASPAVAASQLCSVASMVEGGRALPAAVVLAWLKTRPVELRDRTITG